MATEDSRNLVRQAVTCYAEFYKELASGDGHQAISRLSQIRDIDREARNNLNADELGLYQIRRSQLMKTFRKRLFSELHSQVEVEVLKAAEELVASIECDIVEQ